MHNHWEIEKKWQNYWKEHNTFKTPELSSKPGFYVLDMFPYPSGAGLHVGHPEGYTANDILARYKHAKGFNVLHPMGWDAFGLPAENYAIKTWVHPKITTAENIATFKRQIQSLGFSYDWDREIDTTDPEYFRWTQWIFLKLFEAGLAYEQDLPINYCPSCKTGLANEEVLSDFSCERCGTQVEKKKIRQWVLAITKYAERLLSDVDDLDWPEGIKDMQRNWIGKSEGCEFELKKSDDETKSIRVYTTRVDTVFGMTYAVIAPDHKDVEGFIAPEHTDECHAYIKKANNQSDQDRTADWKEKTGVFTGSYVTNPYNGEQVPLWIADYVLWNYGTWAVMAVPAHDERDFEFAKKYNLPIKCVIQPLFNETDRWDNELKDSKEVKALAWELAFTAKNSHLINSWEYNGMSTKDALEKFAEIAEKENFWTKKVNYKLRDWLFSRQRYWGEPIPLIHIQDEDIEKLPTSASSDAWIKDGNILMVGEKEFSKIYDGIYGKIVCDYNLPLELPEVEAYEPAGDGQSPLSQVPEFTQVEIAPNLSGHRETNTMPQWGGSCWYYLRFMDPKNQDALVGEDAEKYWGSVDSYVGGAEHAVLHLLYARFWHKFLYDIGVVSTTEPFYRLRNQGMILGMSYKNKQGKLIASDMVEEKDGKFLDKETGNILEKIPAKMSKSLKNVVNPDDIVKQYGADTLRLYEMYMGDFADTKPWDTSSIIGLRRYLDKVHATFIENKERSAQSDDEAMKMLHKTIKKVGNDIENYKFNTAIAQMMICLNTGLPKDAAKMQEWKLKYTQLLHPFAPHMAEEIWEKISMKKNPVLRAYFATGNDGKIKRAQSVLDTLRSKMTLEKIPDLIEVEETGATPMECAMQKIEAYRESGYTIPVIAGDTAVYFENQDFDSTMVRRAAIEKSGKNESELSKREIAEIMIDFYAAKAKSEWGEIPFYYTDAFVVLHPNGEIKQFEYKRHYILTDTSKWDIYEDAPMRSLYISKVTGKRACETTMEDYIKEFACQGEAFKELFSLHGNSIFFTSWPEYDEAMTIDSEVTIWVQVLGKLRGEIQISKDEDKDSVLSKARSQETVAKWLEGKEIVKEIYVPGKIVNIVVK